MLMAGLIVAWKLPKREDCYIHMGIAVYDLNDTFMEKYIRTLQDMIEKQKLQEGKYPTKSIMQMEKIRNRKNSCSICMRRSMISCWLTW